MIATESRAYGRGVLLGALLLATVANAADFPRIDREIGSVYAAVNRYPTAELTELTDGHTSVVRERFRLYAELRHWARGADIEVPTDARLRREELAGLADLGEIMSRDGGPRLSQDDLSTIEAHTVATGEDRNSGPYTLAVVPDGVERIIALQIGDRLYLVDARLLERAGT